MYLKQEWFLFPTHFVPKTFKNITTETFIPTEKIALESKIFKSKNDKAPTIILFAGNAQNAISVGKLIWNAFGREVNIATMNYRGYGGSNGVPSEENLHADALTFTRYVKAQYPQRKLYIMGISLGTAVASYVASKEDIEGLILMTPFDNMLNVSRSKYPYLPIKYMLKHHFNSKKHLRNATIPVSIIRAGKDEVIPARYTESLVNSLQNVTYDATLENMSHTQILTEPHFKKLKEVLKNSLESLAQ